MKYWSPELLAIVVRFFSSPKQLELVLKLWSLSPIFYDCLNSVSPLWKHLSLATTSSLGLEFASRRDCTLVLDKPPRWSALFDHPLFSVSIRRLRVAKGLSCPKGWTERVFRLDHLHLEGHHGMCSYDFSTLCHLTVLTLGPSTIFHVNDLSTLETLRYLHTITIGSKNRIGQQGLAHVCRVPSLATLVLGKQNVTGNDLVCLTTSPNITALSIGKDSRAGLGIYYIAALPKLVSLSFGKNNFRPDELDALPRLLPILTHLTIGSQSLVSTHETEWISRLSNLCWLEIGSYNNIGEKGVNYLSRLPRLVSLKLGRQNNLGANGAYFLSRMSTLTCLEIGAENNLKVQGAFLLDMPRLSSLKIGGRNWIGPLTSQALSSKSNLTQLTIGSYNKIGTEGARFLSTLERLTSLIIKSNNEIGEEGARILCSSSSLAHLEISDENKIGTKAVGRLAQAEVHHKTFTSHVDKTQFGLALVSICLRMTAILFFLFSHWTMNHNIFLGPVQSSFKVPTWLEDNTAKYRTMFGWTEFVSLSFGNPISIHHRVHETLLPSYSRLAALVFWGIAAHFVFDVILFWRLVHVSRVEKGLWIACLASLWPLLFAYWLHACECIRQDSVTTQGVCEMNTSFWEFLGICLASFFVDILHAYCIQKNVRLQASVYFFHAYFICGTCKTTNGNQPLNKVMKIVQ